MTLLRASVFTNVVLSLFMVFMIGLNMKLNSQVERCIEVKDQIIAQRDDARRERDELATSNALLKLENAALNRQVADGFAPSEKMQEQSLEALRLVHLTTDLANIWTDIADKAISTSDLCLSREKISKLVASDEMTPESAKLARDEILNELELNTDITLPDLFEKVRAKKAEIKALLKKLGVPLSKKP